MRISDWSSDVCSSDLNLPPVTGYPAQTKRAARIGRPSCCKSLAANQRFENWKLLRALARPYFLRSTVRLSRVRKPSFFTALRSAGRSEEHTSELQSLMRISYAVFCLTQKKTTATPLSPIQHRTTLATRLCNTIL